jgi:signal transduction histidine kinase
LETTRAAVHRRGKSDKVEATLHVADDLAQYYLLDGARLSQVVGNLTDNAAKFTNEGEIRISVELVEAPDGASPLQLQVKVRDTGGGIEKNAQKMIFDRFRQVDQGLKRQHDGAGLGLAISSEIAELMGGSLELTEVPRDGFATEFLFLIPTQAITEPADE